MLPPSMLFDTRLSRDVWKSKYSNNGQDAYITDTMHRVALAIMPNKLDHYRTKLNAGILMPAGRIVAGAGTGNRVTLMNCYVMGTVKDSLDGIFDELQKSALTMQQGGGIGTNFSSLRPEGALLKRTGSYSSGPLPFMDTWDAMCRTIMSAGHRRGAMMGTMHISHPDIRKFIAAKRTKGRMTNFNISILVPDAFMEAVTNDDLWYLHFPTPKQEWSETEKAGRAYVLPDKTQTYVYEKVSARDLWDEITRNTYEYSEPGVIFIDRINSLNNLNYCEDIQCTNPCGEQPLPPYGACDLGHINVAALVADPWKPTARMDFEAIASAAADMTVFLDKVIDVTGYPLREQADEQKAKRRIGVGVTGLADALNALGVRYGSETARVIVRNIMSTIAESCYRTSMSRAATLAPFPLWDPKLFNTSFIDKFAPNLRDDIMKNGLRNGVLLTVAPTGTMSSFYGNVSAGCEPVFSHKIRRKVRQADDSFLEYDEYSLSVRSYAYHNGTSFDEAYQYLKQNSHLYPTVKDLTVNEHITMQAACQQWVDASISKTVNIPTETPYEEFKNVYALAYQAGCKGCTTYRPSDVRGSILEDAADKETKTTTEQPRETQEPDRTEPALSGATQLSSLSPEPVRENVGITTRETPRPKVLSGQTYQIRWPAYSASVYVTINEDETGRLVEMFIASKNAHFAEWSTSLSVMVSKLLRLGVEPMSIADELKQITLAQEPAWIDGILYRSIIAMIGSVLEDYVKGNPLYETDSGTGVDLAKPVVKRGETHYRDATCGKCGSSSLSMQEGCLTCLDCGNSKCG